MASVSQPRTRSDKMLDELLAAINGLKATQVTKEHFDNKLDHLETRLNDHQQQLTSIDTRLKAVESTSTDPGMIYKELYDQECRKSNVIIFNFPELPSSTKKADYYKKEINQIYRCFNKMGIVSSNDNKVNMRILRLGKASCPEKPRPLRITFKNKDVKEKVLALAHNLRGDEAWGSIVITDDLTKKQQEMGKVERQRLLTLAETKNSERTADDNSKEVEWKVIGSYGRHNLRLHKFRKRVEEEDD